MGCKVERARAICTAVFALVWVFSLDSPGEALDNGLAITPPMVSLLSRKRIMLLSDNTILAALTLKTPYTQGWNTWNSFHEEIEEKMVRESAEILISSGLAAAGANFPFYLQVCCLVSCHYHARAQHSRMCLRCAGYKYFNLDGENGVQFQLLLPAAVV